MEGVHAFLQVTTIFTRMTRKMGAELLFLLTCFEHPRCTGTVTSLHPFVGSNNTLGPDNRTYIQTIYVNCVYFLSNIVSVWVLLTIGSEWNFIWSAPSTGARQFKINRPRSVRIIRRPPFQLFPQGLLSTEGTIPMKRLQWDVYRLCDIRQI